MIQRALATKVMDEPAPRAWVPRDQCAQGPGIAVTQIKLEDRWASRGKIYWLSLSIHLLEARSHSSRLEWGGLARELPRGLQYSIEHAPMPLTTGKDQSANVCNGAIIVES